MSKSSSTTSSTTSKYKHPVYRSDDRPRRFSSEMVAEMVRDMKEDKLWEELKNLYESED